ncbi:MAG: DUF445 domain-containing protein [Arcobacter sp.]|nr:MAG: DUF445 domain-containing protein [Arcobacter sp.]
MNKSLGTNIIVSLVVIVGYLLENDIIFTVGLFALSGAVTNWIAVHMLFEKVPFLYGSGVIENKFDSFKNSIHNLMMNEFFTKENLKSFFASELDSAKNNIDFEKILHKTDFSPAYDSLKTAVMESSFGNMLGMFGGEQALEPLKEPFIEKLQKSIVEISNTKAFQEMLNESLKEDNLSDEIYDKLSVIVNKRLNELSPNPSLPSKLTIHLI